MTLETHHLTDPEFVGIRRLTRGDRGTIEDEEMAASLHQRGFIRPQSDGWCVTVLGHRTFLSDLYRSF
jgi:hypothetical protein